MAAPIIPASTILAEESQVATVEMKEKDEQTQSDVYLVAFNLPTDAENPKDWPTSRKWAVTTVLSATGFNRILVSTVMAPALGKISTELDMNSAEAIMSLSIYLLATAFGPLVIGPLSEIYGRRNILHATSVWFLAWNIACGFANTKEVLIAARFLAGFGASSIFALAGGVLGDIWTPEERGKSLGVYLLIPVLGAAVGPIIGGFMTERVTWRWMFWSTSAFQALMIVYAMFTFHETFAPLILSRRAQRIRRNTGNNSYQTANERSEDAMSLSYILWKALTRPMRLLAFHPIIQIHSVISAFHYGLLYIVLTSFADLWTHRYHHSIEISGLHYIAVGLGELLGAHASGGVMDALFRRSRRRQGAEGDIVPESRIPLIFPAAFLRSAGFVFYAWCAQYKVHWAAVDAAILVSTFGMQIAGMPMQAYVIDAYKDHTSSAMAATQFLSSLTAFLFPLFTPTMYEALGYGWGNTLLAFASVVIGVPAPWFLWKYGAKLRAKAASSF